MANIFKAENVLGKDHVKTKSDQLQQPQQSVVNQDKQGFQKKEERFIDELK